jgi:hypothetical protein
VSKPLGDGRLLEILCSDEYRGRLFVREREAFPKWLEQGRELSQKMRDWIRSAAARFGIQEEPGRNLFSGLTPERQAEQRARAERFAPKLPWEIDPSK